MNILWFLSAGLFALLMLAIAIVLILIHERRIFCEALSLWRNRAFRLRNRLQRMGLNWHFDPVPGAGKEVMYVTADEMGLLVELFGSKEQFASGIHRLCQYIQEHPEIKERISV